MRFMSTSTDWFAGAEGGSNRNDGVWVEKPKKRPRKVSDAPDKKETLRSEEGLQSKRENDRWREQTRIIIDVAFSHWRALKEENGLRADTDVALPLSDGLVFVKYLE